MSEPDSGRGQKEERRPKQTLEDKKVAGGEIGSAQETNLGYRMRRSQS
jgi:hypothetical protein